MQLSGTELRVDGSEHYAQALDLESLRDGEGWFADGSGGFQVYVGPGDDTPIEWKIDRLAKPLIAQALDLVVDPTEEPLTDEDQIRLFVLAPSPAGFGVQSRGLGREISYVLYQLDLVRGG